MVSPEHIDEQKPEDQQPPDPPEEQQMLPMSEKKWPWIEPLLRGIAIVLSVIGGVAAVYLVVYSYQPWLELGYENAAADQLAYLRLVAFLLVCIVAFVSAVLFRSWWALLFVPSAIGFVVLGASYLSNQIVPDLLGYDDVALGVFFNSTSCIPSAVIGAFLGSPIGVFWKKRQPL